MARLYKLMLLSVMLLCSGCSKQVLVHYDDVEKNNWVRVTLFSGQFVEGTVVRTEPYQLTIHSKERPISIETSKISKITRIPPAYDDFGECISEEEITAVKTNRNATIFGIGGGLLSFGISFFTGSMLAQSSDDGGTILAATTGAGGILGTALFIQAGKRQDRKEAVNLIRHEHQSRQIKRAGPKPSANDLQKQLDEEKRKQEELRKQREKLLRELEQTKKK
jgi:hypothetical protein